MKVCIYCSSSEKIDPEYFNDAFLLGKGIAVKGWELVYGGANCGLMRALAETVREHGGKVNGIIPACIAERGKAAQNISSLVVTEDMKERKHLLREAGDAFVALPGGWGTLEEITEVITLKQLGFHRKPIVFLNTGGFYDLFFRFIDRSRQEYFISEAYRNLYVIADTPEEALRYIETYRESEVTGKY